MAQAELLTELESIKQELTRRRARTSLFDFTRYTFPEYVPHWHNRLICRFIDDFLISGDTIALIECPPRHGKSELVSRRLPAYYLGKWPAKRIIACSYSIDLASRMNRDAQRIIDSDPYRELFPETTLSGSSVAVGTWRRNTETFEVVTLGGEYQAAGVGGGITGMGADLGIIDDPVKNREEADSSTYRNKCWEWFTSTFYPRLEKGGRIIITATRWHEDDLTARVLDRIPAQIRRLRLPAVKEGPPDELDPREEGGALWPDKYDGPALRTIREAVGERNWVSLYQQTPKAAEGNIYRREWWRYYRHLPETRILAKIHSWDTAFKTSKTADQSACIVAYRYETGVYLRRVVAGHFEFPQLEQEIKSEHGRDAATALLIEDKASGQSVLQTLSQTTDLPLVAVKPTADKAGRAEQASPYVAAGNVYLPEGEPWVADFVNDMCSFPAIRYKDTADAFSQLIIWVLENASKPLEIKTGKPSSVLSFNRTQSAGW